MAEPYTSKYSGAQIDAAVKAIGTIPAVYVSYKEYKASMETLQQATNSMVASFNKFFAGVNLNEQTFLKLFNDETAKINNRMTTIENQYDQMVIDFPGIRYEKI